MIFIIHNVIDSCENIEGKKYSVTGLDYSLEEWKTENKVRESADPRIHRLCKVEAKYDIQHYHDSAIMECLLFILKYSREKKTDITTIEFNCKV